MEYFLSTKQYFSITMFHWVGDAVGGPGILPHSYSFKESEWKE
jgi:hypothetical protein